MKKYFVLFIFISFADSVFAQGTIPGEVYSFFATQQNRTKYHKRLIDTIIKQNLSQPLTDSTEGIWNEALWSMELLIYRNDYSKQKLTQAWKQAANLSEDFQKNLLEATYSLYPSLFKKQVNNLLHSTASAPVFIRCSEYLLQHDSIRATRDTIQSLISKKFPGTNDTGLTILQSRLVFKQKKSLPPLKEIFDKKFLAGQTVIYSLQRKDRSYPGLVIIRRPDGNFVKNSDSSLFYTSQLARAITNYPYYISYGNTPQGILRWTGFEISRNYAIGPTPNLQLLLPYEAKPSVFFADSSLANANINWQKDMYASMLPESWKDYDGIYESYYAGAMGRNAIIMHGTTIDPSYYKGQPYYPQTPSLGCLCSYEEWNKDGMRVKSNQQKIDDALDSFEASNGYVVVIELNDAKKPVSIADIKNFIRETEKIK